MFKIQNITGGSLSLKLEKMCIILPKNASYDLDGVCSRKWINSDPDLQRLLGKAIRVLHDSEKSIPKMVIDTNEKTFKLLNKEEKPSVTLPVNTYSPKEASAIPPVIPQSAAPHVRGNVSIKQPISTSNIPQPKLPTPVVDEPIIVDLSKFIEADAATKSDLEELYKEFPELKPKKRGRRSKKAKLEEVDGSN